MKTNFQYFLCVKNLFWVVLATMFSTVTHAEIYKHIDENGRVTYSNVKMKGATKLELEQPAPGVGTTPATNRTPAAKTPSPADFPKVSPEAQNQRDDKRKSVLKAELEAEKKALEDAKKAYAEGESNPEVFRTADGRTFRNVAKYEEKMKKLQDEVDSHQRNIEMLEKEISRLN